MKSYFYEKILSTKKKEMMTMNELAIFSVFAGLFIYLSPVSLQLLPTFDLSKIVEIVIAITWKAWINT